jgi:hypothetical protein
MRSSSGEKIMKYLRITMPNCQKYDVPAYLIAENRAKYYANKEGQDKYEEEYNYCLNDDYELKDWAANNMNWEDVKDKAIKVGKKEDTDYQEGWINGEKEMVSR